MSCLLLLLHGTRSAKVENSLFPEIIYSRCIDPGKHGRARIQDRRDSLSFLCHPHRFYDKIFPGFRGMEKQKKLKTISWRFNSWNIHIFPSIHPSIDSGQFHSKNANFDGGSPHGRCYLASKFHQKALRASSYRLDNEWEKQDMQIFWYMLSCKRLAGGRIITPLGPDRTSRSWAQRNCRGVNILHTKFLGAAQFGKRLLHFALLIMQQERYSIFVIFLIIIGQNTRPLLTVNFLLMLICSFCRFFSLVCVYLIYLLTKKYTFLFYKVSFKIQKCIFLWLQSKEKII